MTRYKGGHQGKSRTEKQFYSDYIRKRDYSPTVDESIDFDETTDDDNEFSIKQNKKPRKRPIREILFEKWEEYWFHIISGVVAIGLTFFLIDAKVGLAQLFERTDNMNNSINEINESVDEVEKTLDKSIDDIIEKNHQQDLDIQAIKIKDELNTDKKADKK